VLEFNREVSVDTTGWYDLSEDVKDYKRPLRASARNHVGRPIPGTPIEYKHEIPIKTDTIGSSDIYFWSNELRDLHCIIQENSPNERKNYDIIVRAHSCKVMKGGGQVIRHVTTFLVTNDDAFAIWFKICHYDLVDEPKPYRITP